MNTRNRMQQTLNFQEPDRVPMDIGATPVSGMHVTSVYLLRQALGLDRPGEPVKVSNIYQMLGEIKPDLAEALGIDTVPLESRTNSFGIPNDGWKEWQTFDGTPVLVQEGFNTTLNPDGSLYMYPKGDKSAPPSGHMPEGGYYFDAIVRQPEIDDENLNVEDNLEEFTFLTEEDLSWYRTHADRLYAETDKAIVANIGGTGFGDIALVPAVQLRHPKGIRDIEEWYVSVVLRQDYIRDVFARQAEIALENLERFYHAVGDKVSVIFMSGTDFGGQQALIFSPRVYRELFFPFQKKLNDWVHTHTHWKTFLHTDGAISSLIPGFIEAGFDILNPVQWTAAGMFPEALKVEYGKKLVFWGAGVDTQKTLPFDTPDEVSAEVRRVVEIFSPGGGYVFGGVHNIQAGVPVENLLAFFNTFNQYRNY